MSRKLRIIVVDDSTIYRKILGRQLARFDDVEVVAEYDNGNELLKNIDDVNPDAILLDMEMPELDGLSSLEKLSERSDDIPVLIISGKQDADKTLKALNLGALDVIPKPSGANSQEKRLHADLSRGLSVVRARCGGNLRSKQSPASRPAATAVQAVARTQTKPPQSSSDSNDRIVVVGVSTGGPQALDKIVRSIDAGLNVPILIVQHMPSGFTSSLADALNSRCALEVAEARPGDAVQAGRILVAPGGTHMELARGVSGALQIRLHNGEAVQGCRPSVDTLFHSVNKCFEGKVLAIILTGMGQDGCDGMRALREGGARCIAQNEATSVVYGMPRSVVEAGLADEVVPLDQIAAKMHAFGRSMPGGRK